MTDIFVTLGLNRKSRNLLEVQAKAKVFPCITKGWLDCYLIADKLYCHGIWVPLSQRTFKLCQKFCPPDWLTQLINLYHITFSSVWKLKFSNNVLCYSNIERWSIASKNSVYCFSPEDIHICYNHSPGGFCNILGCLTAFTNVLSCAGAILLLG